MRRIVKKWTDSISSTWSLEDFQLKNTTIRREASPIQTTEYRLEMEWFPPGTEMIDDLNPPGTVYAEVNLDYGFLTSFIVVQSDDRRQEPPLLPSAKLKDVVAWIEAQTGLKQEVDFRLKREEQEKDGHQYFFTSIVNSKKVSPAGYIEIKVNEKGSVVFYSLSGFFPKLYQEISIEPSREEEIKKVDEFKEQQMVLFGTLEEQGYRLLYGVEEAFVDTIENEFVLEWDQDAPVQKLSMSKDAIGEHWKAFLNSQIVNEEEMSVQISHPDILPISASERCDFLKVMAGYMQTHYPNESGQWKVVTMERRYGYMEATVTPTATLGRFFDKVKFIYDPKNNMIIRVLDKRELFNEMVDFPLPQPKITKEEAIKILDQDIFFERYYVYDTVKKTLKPTWMIDCHAFVDALTGEKVFES